MANLGYKIVRLLLGTIMVSIAITARADLATPFYTTQTITFSVIPATTITRRLITTTGTEYLEAVLPSLPEPNASIVKLFTKYPTNGTHTYWWPKKGEGHYDGSTTNIILNGQIVMTGEPKARTYCCGLTLEVFYKYLKANPELLSRAAGDYDKLKSLWFCRDINSPGPLDAMEATQTGHKIADLEQAMPGDFVQLWRSNKSGHSVIFVNWLRGAKGERIGIQYWSTQIKTGGIGLNSELFGSVPGLGMVSEEHLSVARPLNIH